MVPGVFLLLRLRFFDLGCCARFGGFFDEFAARGNAAAVVAHGVWVGAGEGLRVVEWWWQFGLNLWRIVGGMGCTDHLYIPRNSGNYSQALTLVESQ